MIWADPDEGQFWKGYARGDRLSLPRIGECEFYRHDSLNQQVEVFDRWGILRYVTYKELETGHGREP